MQRRLTYLLAGLVTVRCNTQLAGKKVRGLKGRESTGNLEFLLHSAPRSKIARAPVTHAIFEFFSRFKHDAAAAAAGRVRHRGPTVDRSLSLQPAAAVPDGRMISASHRRASRHMRRDKRQLRHGTPGR
eukprot:COSAG03_NODE_210_length_10594_cov_32.990472_5_plen_129_part_00